MLRLFQSTGGWAAIFLLSCSALFADVTLRYKTEIKMNPTLSPQLAEMATKGMGGFVPSESSLLFKGGKTYSSQGAITSIADFNKQEIVLVDSAGRRYSTLPLNQLADEFAKGMPAMPPEARAAMSSIKTAVESKSTGRSAEIQGVQTEEKEVVLTMEGPAMPNMPAGPLMRMRCRRETAHSVPASTRMRPSSRCRWKWRSFRPHRSPIRFSPFRRSTRARQLQTSSRIC
jgi:hypothetical protein